MRLKGARLAFCSEIAEGAKLDEATMKKLTGGDPVNAKLLYRNPVQFDPSHTLVMLTNHLPKVRGDDPATWRRIMAVPFDQIVPEASATGGFPNGSRPPLTPSWRGCGPAGRTTRRNGLNPPAAVLDATRQYQLDCDTIARFIDDESVVCDGHGTVGSADLYHAFVAWSKAQGEPTEMTNKAFTEALENRGYSKKRHATAPSGRGSRSSRRRRIGSEVTGCDGFSKSFYSHFPMDSWVTRHNPAPGESWRDSSSNFRCRRSGVSPGLSVRPLRRLPGWSLGSLGMCPVSVGAPSLPSSSDSLGFSVTSPGVTSASVSGAGSCGVVMSWAVPGP